MSERPVVVLEDERPARKGSGECFYCQEKIGQLHAEDCVLWTKKVLVQATITYEIEVPHSWGVRMIEFHRNEGTWCSDNMIHELEKIDGFCLCDKTHFQYLRDVEEEK